MSLSLLFENRNGKFIDFDVDVLNATPSTPTGTLFHRTDTDDFIFKVNVIRKYFKLNTDVLRHDHFLKLVETARDEEKVMIEIKKAMELERIEKEKAMELERIEKEKAEERAEVVKEVVKEVMKIIRRDYVNLNFAKTK